MHHHIHGEPDAVPADQRRQIELVRMGASAGPLVGRGLIDVLKTKLHMVEPGVDQFFQTLRMQTDAGRDQVDVEP